MTTTATAAPADQAGIGSAAVADVSSAVVPKGPLPLSGGFDGLVDAGNGVSDRSVISVTSTRCVADENTSPRTQLDGDALAYLDAIMVADGSSGDDAAAAVDHHRDAGDDSDNDDDDAVPHAADAGANVPAVDGGVRHTGRAYDAPPPAAPQPQPFPSAVCAALAMRAAVWVLRVEHVMSYRSLVQEQSALHQFAAAMGGANANANAADGSANDYNNDDDDDDNFLPFVRSRVRTAVSAVLASVAAGVAVGAANGGGDGVLVDGGGGVHAPKHLPPVTVTSRRSSVGSHVRMSGQPPLSAVAGARLQHLQHLQQLQQPAAAPTGARRRSDVSGVVGGAAAVGNSDNWKGNAPSAPVSARPRHVAVLPLGPSKRLGRWRRRGFALEAAERAETGWDPRAVGGTDNSTGARTDSGLSL